MVRLVLVLSVIVTFCLPAAQASADPGIPSPSIPPAASPSPSARPSSSAPASVSPTPTSRPSPTASTSTPAIAPEVVRADGAPLEAMRAVIAATSLAERIDAERRLAAAERALLVDRIERTTAMRAAAEAKLTELEARLAAQRAALDRLVQQTYRFSHSSFIETLLQRGSLVDVVVRVDEMGTIAAKQRETVEAIRDLEAQASAQRDELSRESDDLAALSAAVTAKDETLARLAARAAVLVAASQRGPSAVSDAEVEVLRALADDAAREHAATDAALADIGKRAGVSLPAIDRWVWPLQGVVSQTFGPSSLGLEPAVTYRGTTYPHFHDAIDIAAPLGSPVVAAARGRVAFVGHVAGGAMVVIVAHENGYVSLYVHLDDLVQPPPVHAGDVVEAGQRVGSVGLTGITTGPHLHFTLRRGDGPIDPLAVLPSEPTTHP